MSRYKNGFGGGLMELPKNAIAGEVLKWVIGIFIVGLIVGGLAIWILS